LVSSGLTVPEIAKLLGMGPRSVENHKRRIFAKLDANSQALAVSNVASMGLLDARPFPYMSYSDLSGRERELLKLASHGASMRQMANSLGVAPKTVESQLYRMYRKLGVHNRAAALAVAHAYGLIPVEPEPVP
jgi:DNA-binding CsgD family transcriptional regulator